MSTSYTLGWHQAGWAAGVHGSVGGSQELPQSPEPARVATVDTSQIAAWCQETQALPEGCAERCMAGGSSERQGEGSGSSPASDTACFSWDGHGVEELRDSSEDDEKSRRSCKGLGEGLMGPVGHRLLWEGDTVFMHRKGHGREKRAFVENICRLKEFLLSSFSLTSLKGHVRQSSGWEDMGTATGQ